MFLEVKFIQKLNVRPAIAAKGQLDVLLSQTAVQTEAVRTQLVVLSFGNSTASGALAKHAATHFEGGSDEIKPYDIGAAMKNGDLEELFKSLKLISPFVSSPEFLAAMLGYGFGGYVDENGESHLWADHLHGRVSFETLEMRYRKLLVSGEDLLVSSGGVVEEVLPLGQSYLSTPNGRLVITQDGRKIIVPSNGRVVFKLKGEPGVDIQQFDTDDILRYTWRDTETGNDGASGWLRVKHSFDAFWYEAEVVSGSPEWLQKGMSLGQFGNYTKKYRQGFINISARDKQIAIWDEVDSHILIPEMLKVYLGDLQHVTDLDFPIMKGFGLYAQSCYLKGVFVLKSTSNTVETELSLMEGRFAVEIEDIEKGMSSLSEQTAEGFKQTVKKKFVDVATDIEYDVESIIKQTPEEILLKAGLINLKGLVKAEKIDVDNLTARNIDTRVDGNQGVAISKGLCSIELFNKYGKRVLTINDGDDGLPAIEVVGSNSRALISNDRFTTYGRSISDNTQYGMGIQGWRNSRLVFELNENRLKLPTDAVVDIPGLLCAGNIYGEDVSGGSWGAVSIDIKRLAQGKFRLHHDLNHTNYYTQVSPLGLHDGRPMLMTTVVGITLTYVEVWVTDRSNEAPLNGNFSFAIFGNGKKPL